MSQQETIPENDPRFSPIGQMANIAGGGNADWLAPTSGETVDHDGWYRGRHANVHPCALPPEDAAAQAEFIDKFIMRGLAPAAPFISRGDFITAFGSCFAHEIEAFLDRFGYGVAGRVQADGFENTWSQSLIVRCGDGFVNTAAIRHQLEWAARDDEPDFTVWGKIDGQVREYLESNKPGVRQLISRTTVFVFTVGLSEVWYDKITGRVLFGPVPASIFDPARHGVRTIDADENYENLRAIVSLAKTARPAAPIIFTLSPIPLLATYKETSCIVSNSVSKAILRVALDRLMQDFSMTDGIYYFPSYELVTSCFADPWYRDRRHVDPAVVERIMQIFMRYYASDWP